MKSIHQKIIASLRANKNFNDRWGEYESGKFERVTTVILSKLLPIFEAKIDSLSCAHQINTGKFSFTLFKQICRDEGIELLRMELPDRPPEIQGFYTPTYKFEYKDCIWLSPTLTGRQKVFVAAHELGHYLLHKNNVLKRRPRIAYFKYGKRQYKKERTETGSLIDLFAELEADLFAAYLLTERGIK